MTKRARICMSLSTLFDYMISWWLQTDIKLHKNYSRAILERFISTLMHFDRTLMEKPSPQTGALLCYFSFASVTPRAQWGVTIFTDISLWSYCNKCTCFLIWLRRVTYLLMCVLFSAVGGYYFFLKFILSDINSTQFVGQHWQAT